MFSRLIKLGMTDVGVGDMVLKTKTSDFYSLVPSCPLPIFFYPCCFQASWKESEGGTDF